MNDYIAGFTHIGTNDSAWISFRSYSDQSANAYAQRYARDNVLHLEEVTQIREAA